MIRIIKCWLIGHDFSWRFSVDDEFIVVFNCYHCGRWYMANINEKGMVRIK